MKILQKKIILLLLILTALSFLNLTPRPRDIYLCGYENKGGKNIATYWRNGIATYLTDGHSDAEARSIVVFGNDIYVVGVEYSEYTPVAKYWKNGESIPLYEDIKTSFANSIDVIGNDIYICGQEYGRGSATAKYWKNGIAINLTNGKTFALAQSIKVNGKNVYIAGYEGANTGSFEAKFWKNGVPIILAGGTTSMSIFLLGNDIYVAGNKDKENTGKYWKNGAVSTFNINNVVGRVIPRSIAVVGEDVHIVGNVYTDKSYVGFYWKNGVSINLDPKALFCEAYSIVSTNEDIYIGGYTTNDTGKYVAQSWKNGVAAPVKTASKFSSKALCIYIETYL